MNRGKKCLALMLSVLLLTALWAAGCAEGDPGPLIIRDGKLQPMLTWTDPMTLDYTNENSDILRFCVWVETDYDTDADGKADLVKVVLQVPRAAAEGEYKAAVIYDPTPYSAGTLDRYEEDISPLYVKEPFDYEELNQRGEKREPKGSMTTLELAETAKPSLWLYETQINNTNYWTGINDYNYFLVRGYAVAEAAGIGTYGSEGFELCGMKYERDSHKNVIEWLTGDRRAFTDRTGEYEIKADWCSGNVAMTGCSYGGTLPFEVAVSGVKGLKTIIPFAGIANWYDYTNAQGVPLRNAVNYADSLAGFNCGGTFLDEKLEKINPRYGAWLWQIARDQDATNGDYAPIWEIMDYTTAEENHIACSALVVTGMNDYNVTTRHADLMFRAFRKAGKTVKLVLHQDGHNVLNNLSINGTAWQELMNEWLSHYLYGVENGAEQFPEVMAQSNVDGRFLTYEGWTAAEYVEAKASWTEEKTRISTEGLSDYILEYQAKTQNNLTTEDQEAFYRGMDRPLSAVYPLELPENTTVFGVPEVHVKLSTDNVDLDGMMITAVLLDVPEKGTFPAYRPHTENNDLVTRNPLEVAIVQGSGLDDLQLEEFVQEEVPAQRVSFGWTDLQNPGGGFDSSDYVWQDAGAEKGKEKEYTFYMLPTVYTVAPGHHLELVLMTWDPFRVYLDDDFELDPTMKSELASHDYSYTVDNASLKIRIPVASPKE